MDEDGKKLELAEIRNTMIGYWEEIYRGTDVMDELRCVRYQADPKGPQEKIYDCKGDIRLEHTYAMRKRTLERK